MQLYGTGAGKTVQCVRGHIPPSVQSRQRHEVICRTASRSSCFTVIIGSLCCAEQSVSK